MNLEQYKQQLDQHGVLLSYYGPMKQELVENFGEILRQQLSFQQGLLNASDAKPFNKISQTMFHIFIEQAQNIARYSAEISSFENKEVDLRNGIFIIGKNNGFYYIECCNLIKLIHAENIKNQLNLIKTMNKDEIKEYYRKKRKDKRPEHSKGAGLGFIDMAKKSSKIDFQINPVNSQHALFTLKVFI